MALILCRYEDQVVAARRVERMREVSGILNPDELKVIETDLVIHTQMMEVEQKIVHDLQAKLKAHKVAVLVRDMSEPKIDVGCQLLITEAFRDELIDGRRWASWEQDGWDVGCLIMVNSIDPYFGTLKVSMEGHGGTGNVSIAMAQDMRRAYLAR